MSYEVTYRTKEGWKQIFTVPSAQSVTEAMGEAMASLPELQRFPNRIISVLFLEN